MAVWLREGVGASAGWMRTQIPSAIAGAEIAERNGAFVLLAEPGSGLRVNGKELIHGVRVLEHRDEVVDATGSLAYFSTEDPPEAVRYSGPSAKCGRCHVSVGPESLVVKCSCGVLYHHGEPSCFEYGDDPRCVACGRPTRLDGSG